MRITQKDRILQYIRQFGYITSWQAYQDLGVTQLGARISELKEMGYEFSKEREYDKNRFGEQIHFDKYYLKDNMEFENMEHIPVLEGGIV